MKICKKCGESKVLNEFCCDIKAKDGLQSWCKGCKNGYNLRYYKMNPSKRHKRTKEQDIKRYEKNKVHMNVSRMIRHALNGKTKTLPTFKALGYSLQLLEEHLERQFKSGMTWENYGEWHIDHIYPQSKLPYDDVTHPNFLKCWALENLQPLWAADNIRKAASI